MPEEVKEAILKDFKENCEEYLRKSLVRSFAKHRANAIHKPSGKTYFKEINEEVRYKLVAVWVQQVDLRESFAKVVVVGEASVETTYGREMLNKLDITVSLWF
jgi:hypothetical protein